MVVVSSNSNLTSLSYVAGEIIDIQNGATLTVNTTPTVQPGNTQCITQGRLLITNSSTTTPIVWTFNSNTFDFIFQSNGILEIAGQMIVIYTGNGAANQTISFTSIGGVAIDYPGYIEVETGNNTNVYRPWHILPGPGLLGTPVNQYLDLTNHGNGDLGNVCLFNETTKVMTFGNGTNGNVIPTGARVRFPNIHVTSAVNNATATARSLLSVTPAGTAIIENCSFSNAFSFGSISNASAFSLRRVGCVARLTVNAIGKTFVLDRVLTNVDGRASINGIIATNVNAPTATIDRVYASSHIDSVALTLNTIPALRSVNTAEGLCVRKTAAATFPVFINALNDCTITDLTCIAGRIFITNNINTRFVNTKISDTANGVASASAAANALVGQNLIRNVFDGVTLTSPGAPARNAAINLDANCVDTIIKGLNQDLATNGAFLAFAGIRATFYGTTLLNNRLPPALTTSAGAGLSIVRFLGLPAETIQPVAGCRYEFVQATGVSLTVPNYTDVGTFYTIVNNPANTGNLVVGGFGEQIDRAIYNFVGVEGTDYYLDKNGKLFLVTAIAEAIIRSWHPIRSITSFQNVAPTITGTNTGSLTFQFRIANPKDAIATLPWQSLTAANLISALSGLTGYDNNVGFNMHIRITCTGADAARNINQIVMPTNNNAAFAPEVGTVAVGVSGAVEGSLVGVINNTNPSARTLLGTAVVNSAGTASVAVPYNFDGTTIPLLIRVRKPTHEPTELSAAFTGTALSFPVSQKAVTDIAGNAIYGRGSALNKALVGFTVASRKIITVGNGKVKGESLFDAIADFISSEDGILLNEAFRFNGTDGLLLNGWKFRRLNPTDSNAAIDIAVSVDGFPDESPDLETDLGTSYGSIDMRAQTVRSVFSASDAGLVATAVWEKALADLTTPSTAGDQLKKLLTLVQFLGLK